MGDGEERVRDVTPGLFALQSRNAVEIAPKPGTDWATATVPDELVIGPNGVVVTNDGTNFVFVGLMWE